MMHGIATVLPGLLAGLVVGVCELGVEVVGSGCVVNVAMCEACGATTVHGQTLCSSVQHALTVTACAQSGMGCDAI